MLAYLLVALFVKMPLEKIQSVFLCWDLLKAATWDSSEKITVVLECN